MVNKVDEQYLDVLKNIMENGVEKESGRPNMPNTIGISHATIKMDFNEGFPLLTTKKMYYKGIIHELLWFLRGETNIKYLVDNNVNIWNGDAYRWYLKHHEHYSQALHGRGNHEPLSMEGFVEAVKNQSDYPMVSKGYVLGDLGKVYGHQWRNQNGVDQVAEVIDSLKSNPYSRYQIIDGWNKADFPEMALPPCHLLYQFIVRPLDLEERFRIWFTNNKPNRDVVDSFDVKSLENQIKYLDELNIPKFYMDLNMYQRSCDTFLGVPFNLASMGLLVMIMSKVTNMVPGVATWIGGDTHLYVNHIPMVEEQLSREPMELCDVNITKELNTLEDIENLTIDDFIITDYKSHPAIKAELFTGNKK